MNDEIFQSHRRFVVITDPHIKAVTTNLVYTKGNSLEND